jgi:hypothetical protein
MDSVQKDNWWVPLVVRMKLTIRVINLNLPKFTQFTLTTPTTQGPTMILFFFQSKLGFFIQKMYKSSRPFIIPFHPSPVSFIDGVVQCGMEF